jgi:predicted MPP superfamily phosphohydrolase
MPRPIQFLIFFSVALLLIGGVHYYFWIRLVRDTGLRAPWQGIATGLLILLAVSMPTAMILGRSRALGPSFTRILAWPAFLWMGVMILLLVTLGASDLVRLGARLVASGHLQDPERRLFFRRLLGGAAATVAAGLSALAVRSALGKVSLRELTVELPLLPPSLAGTTIVQLTDLHIGPTIGRSFLDEIVPRVNALEPDIVAITGDLVDGSVAELRDQVAPIAQLKAKRGIFFVTGNHEYYSGAEEWVAELSRLGVKVLRNERVALAEGLELAGIDDYNARGMARGHGPDLPRALEGRDPTRALVLLAHQPRAIDEAARLGVGLQLSGHTHGGQIWPWGYLVRLQSPYVAGLFRVGGAQLYVSKGTGYWGPPMRLAAPAEITRVVLQPARSA